MTRRRTLRDVGARAASVLALGVLLWALSEQVFWSAPPRAGEVGGTLGGIAVYSVLGVLLTAASRRSRAATAAGVLVLGAGYGWLVEGVAATTLYGTAEIPFPATIAWTALAWHLPVVVLGGWWLLPRVLARGVRPTIALSAVAGTGWGIWAAGWGPAAGPPLVFLGFAVVVTALVAGAHLVLAAAPPPTGRALPIVCVVLAAAWFAVVVVPAVPWAPLLLVPLLALVIVALPPGAAASVRPRPRPRATVVFLLIVPAVGTIVRAACIAAFGGLPLQLLAAALLTVTGTAAFITACVLQLRRRAAARRA